MSKAIIEIEKPKCCKECVWYQADLWFGGSCKLVKDENGWNKTIKADGEYDVQNWCPLLPKTETIPIEQLLSILPKYDDYIHTKTYPHNETMEDIYSKGHEEGWNACLKAIKEELDYWEKENE